MIVSGSFPRSAAQVPTNAEPRQNQATPLTRPAVVIEPEVVPGISQPSDARAGDMRWCAPIDDADFDYFRDIAYRHAGIFIADYKRNMVFRRVSKRLRALGLDTFSDYRAVLDRPGQGAELQNLVNVLTTNKTSFFREEHHFHFLRDSALPALKARATTANKRLRIWSAGCSSGEEAYSIAMTLRASLDDIVNRDARILATDIDTDMVDHARRGFYDSEFLDDIPRGYRGRFTGSSGEGTFSMAPATQSLIAFRYHNLLGTWPMKGPFDMIFCRNVVIYFDRETKRGLFDRFADILTPDGLLFIGHSESLFKISQRFRMVGQSVYQRIA